MTYIEVPEKSDLSCEGCSFSKEIMKPKIKKGVVIGKEHTGKWGCFAPWEEPYMSCKKNHVIFVKSE